MHTVCEREAVTGMVEGVALRRALLGHVQRTVVLVLGALCPLETGNAACGVCGGGCVFSSDNNTTNIKKIVWLLILVQLQLLI